MQDDAIVGESLIFPENLSAAGAMSPASFSPGVEKWSSAGLSTVIGKWRGFEGNQFRLSLRRRRNGIRGCVLVDLRAAQGCGQRRARLRIILHETCRAARSTRAYGDRRRIEDALGVDESRDV